jgi:putative DNA primase/helicase
MNTISKSNETRKGGVTDFAGRKKLPLQFLRQVGITEAGAGIRFDYGADSRARIRRDISDAHSTIWCRDDERPMRVYRHPEAPTGSTLLVCEGESDSITAWTHGYPCIGVPGALMAKLIRPDDVQGTERVMIVREPDDAGTKFVRKVADRLLDIGYTGRVLQVSLDGHKDISDLHVALRRHDPIQYKAYFRDALDSAIANARPVGSEEPKPTRSERTLTTVCAADIVPEKIEWLWEGRIPRGCVTMMAGDPEAGKSFASMAIAAKVTTGAPFPDDGTSRKPQRVLLFNGEDPMKSVIRPRAANVGMALENLFIIDKEMDAKGNEHHFTLSSIDLIRAKMDEIGDVGLVILDPVGDLLSSVDGNREGDVRLGLQPLRDLAEETGVAILLICHLSKKEQNRAIYRLSGSLALGAIPRSVLMVGIHPDDPQRRVISRAKGNLCQTPASVEFSIDKEGRFWWGQTTEVTAEDLVQPASRYGGARSDATNFLRTILADGPVASAIVEEKAAAKGISISTLKRARNLIGVESKKVGQVWQLRLPDIQGDH